MARYESYLRSILMSASAICLCASVAACGYKGPLYLPPPPDTLQGQGQTAPREPAKIPPMSENPSLEPAPTVIE